MRRHIEDLDRLYQVTFMLITFWVVTIGFFLDAFHEGNNSKVLLEWSPLILLYIASYLFFLYHKNKRTIQKRRVIVSQAILKVNLICLGLIILLNSLIERADKWDNVFEWLVIYTHLSLLLAVAFLLPLILLYWQVTLSRKKLFPL